LRGQLGRIEKLAQAATKRKFPQGLAPTFTVEPGPDAERKIAAFRDECTAAGFDPELALIVIVAPRPETLGPDAFAMRRE